MEEEVAASRRDDDDRAGGEGEINEIKEIRGRRGDEWDGGRRKDVVLRERCRHAAKYGFMRCRYISRDVYIVFYSGKCVPER